MSQESNSRGRDGETWDETGAVRPAEEKHSGPDYGVDRELGQSTSLVRKTQPYAFSGAAKRHPTQSYVSQGAIINPKGTQPYIILGAAELRLDADNGGTTGPIIEQAPESSLESRRAVPHRSSNNPPPMPVDGIHIIGEKELEQLHLDAKREFKKVFLSEFLECVSKKPGKVSKTDFADVFSAAEENTRLTLARGGIGDYPFYSAYYLDENLGEMRCRELRKVAQDIVRGRAYEVKETKFPAWVKNFDVLRIVGSIARKLETQAGDVDDPTYGLRETLGVQHGVSPRIDRAILAADDRQLDEIVAHMTAIVVHNLGANLPKLKGDNLWLLYFYQEQQPELIFEIYQPLYDHLYDFCVKQRRRKVEQVEPAPPRIIFEHPKEKVIIAEPFRVPADYVVREPEPEPQLQTQPLPLPPLLPSIEPAVEKNDSGVEKSWARGKWERLPPWARKAVTGVLAGAALAGTAYIGKKVYDSYQHDGIASGVKSTPSATPSSIPTTVPTTPPDVVKAPVAPAQTPAPTLSAAELAKIPSERLRDMIASGKIQLEGNGRGFGAQLAKEFYKIATPEQRQKLKDIQHKFDVGSYATYVERFPTSGDVESAQYDSKNAYHNLAKTITRDGYMGKPSQWDRGILSRPTGSSWTPAEAREYFKKNEAMMHRLHYDYRSKNNIHMGGWGGDRFDLRDATGQFLPYFADMAEAVDIHLNVATVPGVAPKNGMDGGTHGFLQFNAPHNFVAPGILQPADGSHTEYALNEDHSIDIDLTALEEDESVDVDLSDLETPKVPTLEEKVAIVKGDRRKALLERGEVWVPALSDDMSGSVLQAIENVFIKECSTEQQMIQVKNICSKIRLGQMSDYEVLEDCSTYGRISGEHLSRLKSAAKSNVVVPEKTAYSGPNTDDIDKGWDLEPESQDFGAKLAYNVGAGVDKTLKRVRLAA